MRKTNFHVIINSPFITFLIKYISLFHVMKVLKNSHLARMGKDLVDLTFYRGSADEPWGFRLAGGKDYGQPLTISQVILFL